MTTEPLNALNSTATRRGAVQLSRCQSKKLLVRRPQRGPERCANWSGDTCLTPKEDPSAINKTRMPTKSCRRVARQTDRRAPADDESRCPKRPVEQRTQPHAPRAYRVTGRRTETGGSPQGPKPSRSEATSGRDAGPRTTRQDRGSTKDRRPVAETHAPTKYKDLGSTRQPWASSRSSGWRWGS